MSQTSYERDFAEGFDGGLADSNNIDAASGCIESGEAVKANVGFGLAVKRGSFDRAIAGLTAGAKVLGFLKHKHVEEGALADLETVTVIRQGSMYVRVLADVQAGDPVYVDVATGQVDNVSASGKIHLKSCEFATDALTGELAVLDINLPGDQEVIA